ncbi:MAG: hypothetical protein KGD57_08160, partial [Candidatus Lokiarchaeota archaeon]|nr:hypothetical protein [Candidatus Lokiarchaeota archaeon]
EDILTLKSESPPEKNIPLLIPVMKKGKLIYDLPNLDEIQRFCLENIETLPNKFKKLDNIKVTEVKISESIRNLLNSLIKKFKNEKV